MKANAFIESLKSIEKLHKTVYMWGSFGQPLNEKFIQEKARQYPTYYTGNRQIHLRSLLNKDYFAFDCIGLIKGILWGWSGDASKPRGGAGYATNGIPDIDANSFIKLCKEVTTDFSKIQPGEAVWLAGHIGVYIGDGKVIEATPGWKNGVQITNCSNIKTVNGEKNRKWTSHGKIPWVDYSEVEKQQDNSYDWERLIRDSQSSPDKWIAFVKDMSENPPSLHPVAKWLPEFIEKLGGNR